MEADNRQTQSSTPSWRIMGWILAAILLAIPAVAMQFTREATWTSSDFVFAGALLIATGIALELVFHFVSNRRIRIGGAIAILGAFLLVWAEAAVGLFR